MRKVIIAIPLKAVEPSLPPKPCKTLGENINTIPLTNEEKKINK